MPDRENVIKAWECCNPFNRKCKECPYEKDCYHDSISRHMFADALALLKEQEAVQMKISEDYGYIKFGECPKCKAFINNRYFPKSCGCGQAVKWE